MKIKSQFPYVWPHLGFALVAGENDIEESDIPLAAHAKLAHLSKPGMNELGVRLPAPISGYEPSKALVDAANKHFPRNAAAKPRAATLGTLSQSTVAAPAPESPKGDDQRGQKRG